MQNIDELYKAAAEAVAKAEPVSGDLHARPVKVSEYMVDAEVVERLRLALGPALQSLEKVRERVNCGNTFW